MIFGIFRLSEAAAADSLTTLDIPYNVSKQVFLLENKVLLKSESEKLSNAFSLACNCILELSSMPKYNISDNQISSDNNASELPDWLFSHVKCMNLHSLVFNSFER